MRKINWPGAAGLALCALSAAVVIALIWFVFIRPGQHRQDAAQAKAGQIVAEGQTAAGKDAIGVVTDNAGKEAQTDALTRDNNKAIRSAEGAADPVAAGVDDAGRRALCMRRAYAGSAACKRLLNAHP